MSSCDEKLNIFGESQGDKFAELMDIDYLGSIPLTEDVAKAVDDDTIITAKDGKHIVSKEFKSIVNKIEKDFFKD